MRKQQEYIFRDGAAIVVLILAAYAMFLSIQRLNGESLWKHPTNSERGMFADKVAGQRGDILTVVVSETNSMTQSLRTKTDKGGTIENVVNRWLFSPSASSFGTHNGELPATDIEGDNTYDAGGEITNRQTVSARISVHVIDVLPNKNLVIEGVRVVTFSNETQFAVLRGVVRPYDVSPENTVGSDRIADAVVQYISEGSLTEAQKKGWLMKVNDLVNPF